ncbi:MAG: hypothetical protein AAFY31_17940 [Pseudomonadota bacterium]
MMKQYRKVAGTRVSAALLIAALTLPTGAAAAEVALKSYDGSTRIVGEILAYGDGFYRVETALGALLISTNVVACEGSNCPLHVDMADAGELRALPTTQAALKSSN